MNDHVSILDLIDDAVAIIDGDSFAILASNVAFSNWTYDSKVTIGSCLSDAFPAFDGKKLKDFLARGRRYSFEVTVAPYEQRPFPVELSFKSILHMNTPALLVHGRSVAKVHEKEAMLQGFSNIIEQNNRLLSRQKKQVEEQAKKIQDLLNTIDQGIFTFNLDLTVNEEHSVRAEEIFNTSFKGIRLSDILNLNAEQERKFASWLELMTQPKTLRRWTKYASLSPIREWRRYDGDSERLIALEYQPVIEDDKLTKVMVLAKDVTEQRLAEQELAEQQRKQKNHMNRVLACVNSSFTDLQIFFEDAEAVLKEFEACCDISHIKKQHAAIFRSLHTLKGTSGSLGFSAISRASQRLEDLVQQYRQEISGKILENLDEHWSKLWPQYAEELKTEISVAREVFDKIYRGKSDSMMVSRSAYKKIIDNLHKAKNHILKDVLDLDAEPIGDQCRKLQNVIVMFRERSGKAIADLMVDDHGRLVQRDVMRLFEPSLIHLVRNACDHGIEPAEERELAGKPVEGTITIRFTTDNKKVTIEFSDDGRGIDPDAIAAQAVTRGFVTDEEAKSMSNEERLGLVFKSGFSTKNEVTDISGRGVGLDVVKQEMERLGGGVSIVTKKGEGTTFRLWFPLPDTSSDWINLQLTA